MAGEFGAGEGRWTRRDCQNKCWEQRVLSSFAMSKPKRKLTAAERARKRRRKQEYMTVFVHGKQKRVRRPPTIDGMEVEEFIRRNADPVWLHQNELWDYTAGCGEPAAPDKSPDQTSHPPCGDVPF